MPGGSLFPNVDYDPDGHGVTGGSVNPGDWTWMRTPAGERDEYEGHLTRQVASDAAPIPQTRILGVM